MSIWALYPKKNRLYWTNAVTKKGEFDMEENFVGISEDRLHHMLGVARRCYEVAKEMDMPEDFCRKMFAIGWNHDIGYEFSKVSSEHANISESLLKLLGITGNDKNSQKVLHAVRTHGNDTKTKSLEWKILNIADMTIDSRGNRVKVTERLDDIKSRYGSNSAEYEKACHITQMVGLTFETNPELYQNEQEER